MVKYKNPKKLADAGLTIDDAIRAKVKDLDENGKYALKTSHSFYYQVQSVMPATELPNAAFVIRGAKLSMAVVWITLDRHFSYPYFTKAQTILLPSYTARISLSTDVYFWCMTIMLSGIISIFFSLMQSSNNPYF